jgi:hypothetical protein
MVTQNTKQLHDAANDYIQRGLRITLCNGKMPIHANWQSRLYTAESISAEFSVNPQLNVGVVLGSITCLTDIEGDDEQSEVDFMELFDGLEPRTWKFQSKRSVHRLFKYAPSLAELGKTVAKWKSLEIRGCNEKSAQSIFPPSATDDYPRHWLIAPADCDLAEIPESVIRKLVPPKDSEIVVGKKARPGDDFNARGPDWNEILGPHGWAYAGNDGNRTSYWRRPGKQSGVSATAGHIRTDEGQELLYVFTNSAPPLESHKAYTKFAAFAVLNHAADFGAAARALLDSGYGAPSQKGGALSAATRVIDMVTQDSTVELFHTPDGDAFVTVPYDNHWETLHLSSSRFKHYLSHQYYLRSGAVASSKALADAISVLSGIASFEGPELEVNLRIASHKGKIFVDRGDVNWETIEISPSGFRLISQAPVKFWRPKGMLSLPTPVAGGSIEDLRSFVRLDDNGFLLLVGALLSYFRSAGPYPAMILTGEQGTAKSTTADVVRRLIDPKVVQRQAEPKNLESLMVAARNNWVVSYDNLSTLPQWLSDGLCRLSTGGGIGARALYTNADEFVINAQRPVIINSIIDVATKPDLLDRAVVIELHPIPEDQRRDEDAFWTEFAAKQPIILGALIGAISCALSRLPEVQLPSKPRMADFAKWVTAAEPVLGLPAGKFLTVYEGNQHDASGALLDSVIAQAVTQLVDKALKWEGTPTDLYKTLSSSVTDGGRPEHWPGSAAKLTSELRRLAPVLRKAGYSYEGGRPGGRRRVMLAKS